jgi:membrane protease subunit HflK
LVDVEGGNNMMYIPLDKIMSTQSSTSSTLSSSPSISEIADEVISKLRQDQLATRRSESR